MSLEEWRKQCGELNLKAEGLVKERIVGARKGRPDEPKYLHSFRVRDLVSAHHHWDDPDYELFTAALLHDVVEDGGVTFQELKEMGFTDRTIELVRLCTHPMDVEDSAGRWTLMIAKLVEADDDDAWRIKVADLADNLSQSKGLAPEARRFMVEVKGPLVLRLGRVAHSAYNLLEEELVKQRIDLSKQSRYAVTLWVEDFDYDGLTNDFALLGTYEDLCAASICAVTEMEKFVRERLDVKTDWNPVLRDDSMRTAFTSPNKYNKVVFSRSASRKGPDGFDSLYGFIEVAEVPYETVIDERVFNVRETGGYEVFRFFNRSKEGPEAKALFQLKQKPRDAEKCRLWNLTAPTDGDLDNTFEVIHTFADEAGFSRRLVKCNECGQLYLKEFYEVMDRIDGENPQYITYVPVENPEEAGFINQVGVWELRTFTPSLNRDWPKDGKRRIYWIGKR